MQLYMHVCVHLHSILQFNYDWPTKEGVYTVAFICMSLRSEMKGSLEMNGVPVCCIYRYVCVYIA